MNVNFYTLFGTDQAQAPSVTDLIRWGEHLSVGHPEIDSQHKEVLELGNKIYENWRDGVKLEILQADVNRLTDLLEAHFSYEEQVLAEIKYGGLEGHSAEHRSMLNQLKNTREHLRGLRVEGETPRSSVLAPSWPLMQLILGFTIGHIMTSDMGFSRVLAESRESA